MAIDQYHPHRHLVGTPSLPVNVRRRFSLKVLWDPRSPSEATQPQEPEKLSQEYIVDEPGKTPNCDCPSLNKTLKKKKRQILLGNCLETTPRAAHTYLGFVILAQGSFISAGKAFQDKAPSTLSTVLKIPRQNRL